MSEQTTYSYMTKGNETSLTAWQDRAWAAEDRIRELEQERDEARNVLAIALDQLVLSDEARAAGFREGVEAAELACEARVEKHITIHRPMGYVTPAGFRKEGALEEAKACAAVIRALEPGK